MARSLQPTNYLLVTGRARRGTLLPTGSVRRRD